MRISGKEFKEFHDTAWPDGYIWWDNSFYTPDGAADAIDIYAETSQGDMDNAPIIIGDDEMFTVPDDWVLRPEDGPGEEYSVRTLLRRWLKKKNSSTFVVSVPKAKEAELKAVLKALKATIMK